MKSLATVLAGLSIIYSYALWGADISLSAEEQPHLITNQSNKRRALENLKIVDQNIEDVKFNMAASKRNSEIIQHEINQLLDLQKEHLEMSGKYKQYLEQAKPKLAENMKEMKELESIEKKMGKKGPDEVASPELERLRREKLERLKWDSESRLKIAQISKFQTETDRNLKDIASRLKPLTEQLKTWTNRLKEFEGLLEKYSKRKAGIERQISSLTAKISSSSPQSKDTDSRSGKSPDNNR